MTTRPFIVQPQSYPPALDVLGAQITVLASNSATRSHEVTLQQGDEGVGPPPHCPVTQARVRQRDLPWKSNHPNQQDPTPRPRRRCLPSMWQQDQDHQHRPPR